MGEKSDEKKKKPKHLVSRQGDSKNVQILSDIGGKSKIAATPRENDSKTTKLHQRCAPMPGGAVTTQPKKQPMCRYISDEERSELLTVS